MASKLGQHTAYKAAAVVKMIRPSASFELLQCNTGKLTTKKNPKHLPAYETHSIAQSNSLTSPASLLIGNDVQFWLFGSAGRTFADRW